MNMRRFGAVVLMLSVGMAADLFACGDKFLIGGRGTRYQRPKNARAASVLIYADPASPLRHPQESQGRIAAQARRPSRHQGADARSVVDDRVERPLRRDSHRRTARRPTCRSSLASSPDAATVVGIDELVKNRTLASGDRQSGAAARSESEEDRANLLANVVAAAAHRWFASALVVLAAPASAFAQAFTPPPRSDPSLPPGSGWTTPATSSPTVRSSRVDRASPPAR